MIKTEVITLHVRDAVSKTFHITPDEITMHTDLGPEIKVPEKYRKVVEGMIEVGTRVADEYTSIKEINVSGEASDGEMGESAQRIWSEIIE